MRRGSSRKPEDEPGVPSAPESLAFMDAFTVAETADDAPRRANARPDVGTATGSLPAPGFRGRVELAQADAMSAADTVRVLKQLAALIAWAQAQQALVIHRIETGLRRDIEQSLGPVEGPVALSAAAAEVGAALNVPHMSALALVSEASTLCTVNRSTHAQLSQGAISYRHAQRIMEEVQSVPADHAPRFEFELIQLAQGRTCAQFTARARRLRESRWPETISVRHRQALELRRVSLDPKPDGMAELSALVAAEKGQAIHNSLTASARAARSAGDVRTMDQLRTDVFTSLMLPDPSSPVLLLSPGAQSPVPSCEDLTGVRAEIMVLIDADTILGVNDKPAELNGYGPISADAARRLARQALHWTGLVRDSSSGEILAVGRRRKVPAGLKRWLQARDGTCRFPGCRVSAFRTEIDHTVPWSRGGATEHGNLENLCPKHHRLKSLGLWKARQPRPGKMEWVSPLGSRYSTAPQLHYAAIPRVASSRSPSEDAEPPPF